MSQSLESRTALRAVARLSLVLVLCGAVPPAFAAGDDDSSTDPEEAPLCSTGSLNEAYGFSLQGSALKPDGTVAAQFAGVGVETFDGRGTITAGRLMGSSNGGQPVTFTGTYTINSDCIGSKTITMNGQPQHYSLVLVDGGRQIETAETDPGTLLAFAQVLQSATIGGPAH